MQTLNQPVAAIPGQRQLPCSTPQAYNSPPRCTPLVSQLRPAHKQTVAIPRCQPQRSMRLTTRSAQQSEKQVRDDDDDLPFERQLKGRGRAKPKKAQTQLQQQSPPSAAQQVAKMPPADQFESSAVLVLVALFAAIIGQGLFLALSGFLSESLDQFAQDVVYKTFSPTVGLFLACSAGYGLWKTKQEKK